jgi:DNA-binding response OmpR family regulator
MVLRSESSERPSILFVDPGTADVYLPSLRMHFEVAAASSVDQAIRALRAFQPTLVISELTVPEGDGLAVCRQSKALQYPPSVLVTTAVPERVPEALLAGCDGVLMKPFARSLLHTRIGRLLRQRASAWRERAMQQQHATVAGLTELTNAVQSGSNVVWPDVYCPSCSVGNAVAFDAATMKRMWYGCLACRHVWMGPRRETDQRGICDDRHASTA